MLSRDYSTYQRNSTHAPARAQFPSSVDTPCMTNLNIFSLKVPANYWYTNKKTCSKWDECLRDRVLHEGLGERSLPAAQPSSHKHPAVISTAQRGIQLWNPKQFMYTGHTRKDLDLDGYKKEWGEKYATNVNFTFTY